MFQELSSLLPAGFPCRSSDGGFGKKFFPTVSNTVKTASVGEGPIEICE